LTLIAEDVIQLEKQGQYGKIYDRYSSPQLRKQLTKAQFLKTSQCVDVFLGHILKAEFADEPMERETVKTTANGAETEIHTDTVTFAVMRQTGLMKEKLVFVSDGLIFKLNGILWSSSDKA